MESNSLKRMRSDEDESNNNVPQTKVWVSEKLSDSRNPDKMKAVHGELTARFLFSALPTIKIHYSNVCRKNNQNAIQGCSAN